MAQLSRRGVRAALAFAGRIENQAFVEKLLRVVSDEGLQERVLFAGELLPEELRDWYAASDVVILPSYSEGLPRVLLEAQAMERPVVAYRVGGIPAAVRDGKTGFTVRAGDVEGLATRLHQLLTDKMKQRRMGQRGREFVIESFSLDSLVARHEDFYGKAIAG